MDRVRPDRRNFLIALTGGAALFLFAAARNNNRLVVPPIHVPEVSIAQAKALLDAGAIAIDVRDAEAYAIGILRTHWSTATGALPTGRRRRSCCWRQASVTQSISHRASKDGRRRGCRWSMGRRGMRGALPRLERDRFLAMHLT
jgi:hypothetical protein